MVPTTPLWTRLAAGAALVLALAPAALAQEEYDPPSRAMRVSLAEGAVSLQPAGSEGWVDELVNRPLTGGDRLWSDRESRAELDLGSTAVRLGEETAVELLNVDERALQLKLVSGTLGIRVRTLGPDQNVEIDTPLAALTVLAPGEYRIDIDEVANLMRVEALSGQIAATAGRDAASVRGGEQATYSGQGLTNAGITGLPPGDAFDQWSAERDRREDRAAAANYLSRETTGYEDLDEYGSWQVLDTYGPVWVPVVAAGWAPYRSGRWVWVAPWGWSWVDAAPWGFAPFHYGRWVFVGNRWCWAPGPRRGAPVYAPALVAWVGGAGGVGWFALGWNEVYTPPYRVSERYVRAVNVSNLHVSNEYMTSYLASSAGAGPGAARNVPFRNQAVAGAVSTTTRGAFAAALPVEAHPADLPRESLARLAPGRAPPSIVPTLQSVGPRAASVPPTGTEFWRRPVLARTQPPPAPLPFEQQRRALLANSGAVPALRRSDTPRGDVLRIQSRPVANPPARGAPSAPAPGARAARAGSGGSRPPGTPPARVVREPAPARETPPPRQPAPPRDTEREPPPRTAPAHPPAHPPAHAAEPHGRAEPKTGR